MELNIMERKGQLFADSREVAALVGKEHHKLLRDIRTYIDHFNQSKIGSVDYFMEVSYLDEKGEYRARYDITRKGCDLIAHKMTGVKGTAFSAAYINRFYDMERALIARQAPQWQQARVEGTHTRRIETAAISAFVAYARAQGSRNSEKYYIHFTELANDAVGISDRDTASVGQLLSLRVAEQLISNATLMEMAAGTEYHQIYRNVREKVRQIAALAFLPALPSIKAS